MSANYALRFYTMPEMKCFLSHMSALDFWRTVYRTNRAPDGPLRRVTLDSAQCRARDVRDILPNWAEDKLFELEGGTVHLLVNSPAVRCSAKGVRSHVFSRDLPEGSFYRYSENLFIASPEFVFVQLATELSVAELVALGDELCGRYSFDPSSERGIRSRAVPLVSLKRLSSFVESAKYVPGALQAKRALRYIAEGAESPMETETHLLLSLPYRHGGYGVCGLTFNRVIRLSPAARTIAQRSSCRADILLEGCLLDIEFDGKHDHSTPEALESDRRRTNALVDMGYEVIELTSGQVNSLAAFDLIALRVASRAGKRVERRYRGALPARIELRKMLANWNAASGRHR